MVAGRPVVTTRPVTATFVRAGGNRFASLPSGATDPPANGGNSPCYAATLARVSSARDVTAYRAPAATVLLRAVTSVRETLRNARVPSPPFPCGLRLLSIVPLLRVSKPETSRHYVTRARAQCPRVSETFDFARKSKTNRVNPLRPSGGVQIVRPQWPG